MRRFVLRVAVLLVLAPVLAQGCRAPVDGVHYGTEVEPYRDARLVEPGDVAGALVHRLVLIGDAGAPLRDDPTLALLGHWGDAHPERTTVTFLGDNVYPAGLEDADRDHGEWVLLQQLRATDASKVFVPGNHDWGFAWNRNLRVGTLRNQQDFIDAHADLDAVLEPRDGCPGPVSLELAPPSAELPGGLVLLVLDLHWWLLAESERPVCEGIAGTSEFVERLRAELASRAGANVVVAAHHPIRSGGEHGGFSRGFWFDLGAAILYRLYTAQDLVEPSYREMIGVLSNALAEYPPLAMVGGHDHSLQILDGGDEAGLVVVSGAGSKVSRVTAIEGTLYAHAGRGFVVFDVYGGGARNQGTLLVHVVETAEGEEPVLTMSVELARETDASGRGSQVDPP